MDLLDLLMLALRLLIVALLYVFLFVVLRASVSGLRMATPRVRSEALTEKDRLSLIVVEPGTSDYEPGQVIAVRGAATFGRTQLASVVLSDATVSAEHARLERVGRAWVVTDLGSTNGTRVNDAPVRGRAPLAEGDVLSLGAIRLQVQPH